MARTIYSDARWCRSKAAGGQSESRLRLGTGQSCQPANWREDKQRIKSAELSYAKMNRELSELELLATTLLEKAELDGVTYTPEQLGALLKPAPVKVAAPSAEAAPAVRTLAMVYADWKHAYRARLAAKTLSNPQGLINRLAGWRLDTPATPQEFQPDAHGRCRPLEGFCAWLVQDACLSSRRYDAGSSPPSAAGRCAARVQA